MEESVKLPFIRRGIKLPAHILFSICLGLLFSVTVLNYIICGYGYAVIVDGNKVAMVQATDLIEEEIMKLELEANKAYGMEMVPEQEIIFERQFSPGSMVPQEDAWSLVSNDLSFSTTGVVVEVNGIDVAAVKDMGAFNQVVEGLKLAYADSHSVVKEVKIEEAVEARQDDIKPDELKTAEEVTSILLRGTDRVETYVVSRGDTLWDIAGSVGMSVNEIQSANPGASEIIHPGDELNLIVPEPIVNITTTEELAVTEDIPYDTKYVTDSGLWSIQTREVTAGKKGTREVKYLVTKVNGEEVEREEISSEVINEPVTAVVAKGTAQMPSLGSGQFMWPVPPGGVITSGYGWRSGGFHQGVDIGHKTGTRVYASDSGVAKTEYGSGYGNYITIYHGNGYSTRYAHLSGFAISNGQQVSKGQVIGYVGTTGRSTGPHLHFEIRINNNHINPLTKFNI